MCRNIEGCDSRNLAETSVYLPSGVFQIRRWRQLVGHVSGSSAAIRWTWKSGHHSLCLNWPQYLLEDNVLLPINHNRSKQVKIREKESWTNQEEWATEEIRISSWVKKKWFCLKISVYLRSTVKSSQWWPKMKLSTKWREINNWNCSIFITWFEQLTITSNRFPLPTPWHV